MRKLSANEVREYPWGFEPQPGYEYIEVADCCSADSHHGHPYCQVVEEPPAGAEPVSNAVLTESGWRRLWRVPVSA
ncbi:MAG: hypothetical protein H5U04_12375 [Firmicutes bacterium]|nr:hypothetical protein [Bacillota bacterium]